MVIVLSYFAIALLYRMKWFWGMGFIKDRFPEAGYECKTAIFPFVLTLSRPEGDCKKGFGSVLLTYCHHDHEYQPPQLMIPWASFSRHKFVLLLAQCLYPSVTLRPLVTGDRWHCDRCTCDRWHCARWQSTVARRHAGKSLLNSQTTFPLASVSLVPAPAHFWMGRWLCVVNPFTALHCT